MCGLVYERNPGDTWAFTILGDRLPVAAIIVLLYFGFVQVHRVLGFTLIVLALILLVWTSPNRWGAGIALHYLSRTFWPDPADRCRRSAALADLTDINSHEFQGAGSKSGTSRKLSIG